MSKELEEIKTLRGFNQVELNNDENINKSLDVIEKALQRLESIDNANPSEALKTLEDLRKQVSFANSDGCIFNDIYEDIIRDIEIIKQALINEQEQEKEIDRLENQCLDVLGDNIRLKKVLEIIKERQVDVFHLMRSETVEEYNKIWDSSKYCLTQEEFELLKAYFGKNIQK